jgi:hypothetical protein
MYSHISGSKDIATITNVGAGVRGAVDDAVGISFGKVVSDNVGKAVGPVLGNSVGDTVGVAVDRDVGNILMAINTVNVKKQHIRGN